MRRLGRTQGRTSQLRGGLLTCGRETWSAVTSQYTVADARPRLRTSSEVVPGWTKVGNGLGHFPRRRGETTGPALSFRAPYADGVAEASRSDAYFVKDGTVDARLMLPASRNVARRNATTSFGEGL